MIWSVQFSMRVPGFVSEPREKYYRSMLDLARYADEHGCEYILASEHHQAEDGYMTDALMIASALAAVTQRSRIRISALILPLHDPIRAAERTTIVDLLSNGRVDVIVGSGYVKREFDMFGVDYSSRGRLMEEKLPIFLAALSGQPFDHHGTTVKVTPKPVQRPWPPIYLGGTVPIVARRAARHGIGFNPIIDDPGLTDIYLQECKKHGKSPGAVLEVKYKGTTFVAEDVDAEWERLAPYLMHEANSYAQWALEAGTNEHMFRPVVDLNELKSLGMHNVITPEQCIETARRGKEISLNPMAGGIPPALAWESIRTFVDRVLPHFQ